ncbi:MAG TPA: Ig-like domain-containing protein [Burkholderiales bacterium]|nr:Ig-like domain-containing protein [Burkholderiales bacterium]
MNAALPSRTNSTTTLATSGSPALSGANVTFTATVTGSSPTGTVAFASDGTTLSGCSAVSLGGSGNSRTAACSTSSLAVGTHSIVASYGGDTNNASSTSSSLSQVINSSQASTSTSLASSANPANTGTNVTFTASVTGNAPTGNVNFTDGGTSISGCSAVALSGSGNSRTAACSTSGLSAGTHSIVATYSGDSNNGGSASSALSQTINATSALANLGFETPSVGGAYQYGPTGASWTFGGGGGISGNGSAFTSGNPPAPQGAQVAFLQNTSSVTQTGNINAGQYIVSFKAAQRGNYQSGAQVVQVKIDGVVVGQYQPPGTTYTTYQTAPFSIAANGDHSIALVSAGSGSDFTAFVDDVQLVPSNSTATTTTLTSSANPINAGSTVTFTATVNGSAPTGTVNFTDGGASITGCSAITLAGGGNTPTASCSTNVLSAGTHSIVATYSGDSNNGGSASSALSQTINATSSLANLGFETPSVGGGYQYAPAGASWTFGGGAGISANGTAFTSGNPAAPQGAQVAFLQGSGSSVAQTASINAGQYTVTFKAAQRGNYQNGTQVVQVNVDGVVVGQYQPPGTSYTTYQTAPFTISATGNHTLSLVASGTGTDFTAFVDDVQLAP